MPDEFIATTDKSKRVVGERNRFKSKPKSRSDTTLGMKVCKMTRDPALRSQSRLPPWEPGLSGGAVLVTGPRESLVLGLSRTAAPQPHLHSELTSARTAHTEHLSAPIRRGNIYQSTLNPSVIRDTIFTSSLLRKKKAKKAMFTEWNEEQMKSNNP